jgi:hypothetical protein
MTKKQAEDLLKAAIAWQEQGARSKWKSSVSLELWDTIERIRQEQAAGSEPEPPASIKKLLDELAGRFIGWLIREAWG